MGMGGAGIDCAGAGGNRNVKKLFPVISSVRFIKCERSFYGFSSLSSKHTCGGRTDRRTAGAMHNALSCEEVNVVSARVATNRALN